MATPSNLITTAAKVARVDTTSRNMIKASFDLLSESTDTPVPVLVENVTHLLAYLASTAEAGKPIRAMHIDSVAAFMAGVEAISLALPKSTDLDKKNNTLRVLASVGFGPDGEVTTSTSPVAQVGNRKPELRAKYAELVKNYLMSVSSGQPQGQPLAMAAKRLQQTIDNVMRQSSQSTAQPA